MSSKELHELESQDDLVKSKPRNWLKQSTILILGVTALIISPLPIPLPISFHTDVRLAKPDFSFLHYSKQCPGLQFIGTDEFRDRRTKLGELLSGEDRSGWGAYISEPSPNTLYYTNLTTSNWYLSERPWLVAITPSISRGSHLSILTPSFEKSRSQRLPFALSPDDFAQVSWVTWEEAENPYEILLGHLEELKERDGVSIEDAWKIHVEENVRQFVAEGVKEAAGDKVEVGLASLVVREQRMRKTENELKIQRCAGKITLEAIRSVRKLLKLGMTEMDGDRLIRSALTAAGLTELDSIVLFGENAALPHASAGDERTLKRGDFALFDVGGELGGYYSDYTRTVLPDPTPKCHKSSDDWPNARAEKIWATVNNAQKAALAALVDANSTGPVLASSIDKAARDLIGDAGYAKYFTHRVGHGIGLQVHEHPYLNSGNPQELQVGETFSNEPGIYIEKNVDPEGVGIGVRLEDMVLKTTDGWELLSGEPLARSPWSP
ncbi:Creatinase/aminopeptidase [Meredithblackwellia eburnea MCA 4105]